MPTGELFVIAKSLDTSYIIFHERLIILTLIILTLEYQQEIWMDKMYMNTHATILKRNVELNIEYYKMILKMR